MKNWNTPSLVELNTKLTANGGTGQGQDQVKETITNALGQIVETTTFTSVIPIGS